MLHSKVSKLTLAACLLGIGTSGAARGEGYNLLDLGALVPGSTVTEALGINDAGQIVGLSRVNGPQQATLWSRGAVTVFPLAVSGPSSAATAAAINDAGKIVGYETGTPYANAIEWSGGVATALSGSGKFNFAYAINDRGQVVGLTQTVPGGQATEWSGDTVIHLGFLPGSTSSQANGINDRGQVVGHSVGGTRVATEWSAGHVIDLGPGDALAINNRGQVVGYGGNGQATLWSRGVATALGNLPGSTISTANAINDRGQAVGYNIVNGNTSSHATEWSGGKVIDLNTVLTSSGIGWTLDSASDINNSGQIVGEGINPSGEADAFLLTPCARCQIVETLPKSVPEPSTWAMMLLGFAGLGYVGYRQSQRLI